jgi:cellulose synthase/poly-beta-1,6-N-acetylglucosamine synthase-like glycosyltransferase
MFNDFLVFVIFVVSVLGFINLLRLGALSVGADIYEIKRLSKSKDFKKNYSPFIAIIIPAHNEEVCINRTVSSILANTYSRKRIIVVDDGSTDDTTKILRKFKRKNKINNLRIVRQPNGGKASAINNALENHVSGCSLVMVLDADSILDSNAVSSMVQHFSDSRVVAAAANVKVIKGRQVLTVAQRIEYVVSHRMKRALTTYNMEYIVGGVASTFRKKIVKKVDYFDKDTMTEDIDFTLKIINRIGNNHNKVIFASDVVARTEGVLSFKSLVRQRFRWKFGRFQTFHKNREMFFSNNSKYSKQLSWVNLPFTLLSEVLLLLDPLFIFTILVFSFVTGGAIGLLTVYLVTTLFFIINILSENTETKREKAELMMMMPFAYFLIMILSFVDFLALIKSIGKFHTLSKPSINSSHWQHVERIGKDISF